MNQSTGSQWGHKKNKLFFIGAFVCITFLLGFSFAQSSGGANDAGKIQERLERPAEKLSEIDSIAAPKTEKTETRKESEKFRLIGAQLVGNSVFTLAQLAPIYEPYLNREISIAEVDKIVKAITEKYHKDGYFLTRVYAPPQAAEFGILELRVVEGFVERVEFKGDKPGRSSLFKGWAANIQAEKPLKLGTLERNLLLMADILGIGVTPSVK